MCVCMCDLCVMCYAYVCAWCVVCVSPTRLRAILSSNGGGGGGEEGGGNSIVHVVGRHGQHIWWRV